MMWDDHTSPAVLGFDDIDMGPMLSVIADLREHTHEHITVTHIVVKAVAEVLGRHPSLNVLLIRGKPMRRETADVFVQVAIPKSQAGEADLSGIKIAAANTKSVTEIAKELSSRASRVREGGDEDLEQAKRMLNTLPARVVKHAMKWLSDLSFDYGVDVSSLGIKTDPFGSAMVTNVGGFGVYTGFAPLVPFSRTPIVILLGRTEDKPVARDGEVVIRPIMRMAATFDHRLYDGYQIGVLSREIRELLHHPEQLCADLLSDRTPTIH